MKSYLLFTKLLATFSLSITISLIIACRSQNDLDETKSQIPETEKSAQVNTQTFVFECENNMSFVARLERKNITLFLPGSTLTLPRVKSDLVEKYQKGNTAFWSKADEIALEWEGKVYRDCRNNHAKAIWEHAKFNGVEFRAVGNEPGWYLEFYIEEKIVFVTEYGQDKYTFPYIKAEENQEKRTSHWCTQTDEHKLEVIAKAVKCVDTMSGEQFESTVVVKLDGKEYRGCGKSLF